MNQAELQQGLQRVASNFISRLSQAAAEVMEKVEPDTKTGILRQVLLYQSSILDIATGPIPETNLLDMLAFAELSCSAVERHWIPKWLGARGRPLLAAFARLREDVWRLGDQFLSEAQKAQLIGVIEEWQQQNPEQVRVADVRLLDFASVAGDISARRAKEASGLLGRVKSATQAADQALLLAGRGMFLMQRPPFLLRTHVRLRTQEAVGDAALLASRAQSLIDESQNLQPLLADTARVLAWSQELARQTQELAPLVERATGVIERGELQAALAVTDRLTERTLEILRELQAMQAPTGRTIVQLRQEADHLVRRWILYLFAAGAGLIVLFLGAYYLLRRLTAHA